MSKSYIHKSFALDAEAVKNAELVAKQKKKSLTELVNLYFKALSNDASVFELIESRVQPRTGSFIGLLDNKIGNVDSKRMLRL